MRLLVILITFITLSFAVSGFAGQSVFQSGSLIPEFGKVAAVETDFPIADGTVMKVSFDVSEQADEGTLNRKLISAARFLNMHVAAGLSAKDLKLAIVVHGGASRDLLQNNAYKKRFGIDNDNTALIQALIKNNVEVILCGQSAAYHDVSKDMLLPGVKMALSAMTAHALLQQDDYTLNPF